MNQNLICGLFLLFTILVGSTALPNTAECQLNQTHQGESGESGESVHMFAGIDQFEGHLLSPYKVKEVEGLYNEAYDYLGQDHDPSEKKVNHLIQFASCKVRSLNYDELPEGFFCQTTLDLIRNDSYQRFTYYTILLSTQDQRLQDWLVEELLIGKSFRLWSGRYLQRLFGFFVGNSKYGSDGTIEGEKYSAQRYRDAYVTDARPMLVDGSYKFEAYAAPYTGLLLYAYFENPSEDEKEFMIKYIGNLGELFDIGILIQELQYLGMLE